MVAVDRHPDIMLQPGWPWSTLYGCADYDGDANPHQGPKLDASDHPASRPRSTLCMIPPCRK
jgi:hypothetical protein